jgi:predicted metallo-beta-lactamase superfamily hydrolase
LIELVPIAAESVGVRSMCCAIKTPDVSILFDAGASLGLRHGLAPHPREYLALAEARRRIRDYAKEVEIVTISHYHFDHFTPPFKSDNVWTFASKEEAAAIYAGKRVLIKDVREDINPSQRERGWIFQNYIGPLARSVEEADGKAFRFGRTTLKFSPPLGHGQTESELGYVLVATITHGGESVTIAPDVQGPISEGALGYIMRCKSELLFLGGPPTYLAQTKVQEGMLAQSIENMKRLASTTPTMLIDHHLLRDIDWRDKVREVFAVAERNSNTIKTAAGHLGLGDSLLEASRKVLYEREPPRDEFLAWTRLSMERRRRIPPPL